MKVTPPSALAAPALALALALGATGVDARPAEVLRDEPVTSTRSDLELRIHSYHQRLRMLQIPQLQASITNRGEHPVTLLHPMDGGHAGFRSPRVGWSVLADGQGGEHVYVPPYKRHHNCGNMKPLSEDDFVTLAPGESMRLDGWLGFNRLPSTGRFRAVLVYENLPERPWSWWRIQHPDTPPELWNRLAASTAVRLVSNELVFEVVP